MGLGYGMYIQAFNSLGFITCFYFFTHAWCMLCDGSKIPSWILYGYSRSESKMWILECRLSNYLTSVVCKVVYSLNFWTDFTKHLVPWYNWLVSKFWSRLNMFMKMVHGVIFNVWLTSNELKLLVMNSLYSMILL